MMRPVGAGLDRHPYRREPLPRIAQGPERGGARRRGSAPSPVRHARRVAERCRDQPCLSHAYRTSRSLPARAHQCNQSCPAPALAAARVADLVLVPCRASILDLRAVTASQTIAQLAGTPASAVLCGVPARGSLADEAQATLEAHGLPVAPVRIGHRAAFVHAATTGQGVHEYEPHGKAMREITRLYEWTCRHASQTAAMLNGA